MERTPDAAANMARFASSVRRERLDVGYLAHGNITRVGGMEIIPWQLSERAVRQKFREHVACRRVERRGVKIFHAVKEAGAANKSIEDHAAGIMPGTVIAHI